MLIHPVVYIIIGLLHVLLGLHDLGLLPHWDQSLATHQEKQSQIGEKDSSN